MNALETIIVDIGKFFKGTGSDLEKFSVAFVKLFKKAPSALQAVENFVNETAPVIIAAVALADPLAEPEAAAGLAVAETGLAAIQAAATAAVSGQSLVTNLENFATTVPALLAGIAIKNPTLKATIERVVTLVVGECKVLIPAVQSWANQIKANMEGSAVPAASA